MSQNTVKKQDETPENAPAPKNASRKARSTVFGRILKGDIFTGNAVTQFLPYVGFLTMLTLLYIANAYYAERKVNRINQLNKRVKDLHSQYVSVKAELMYGMQRTELSKALTEEGIKENTTPPKVIMVESNENEKIY